MGNTNLKIKYYGKTGKENFSVSLMGKRYNFKNVGTNATSHQAIIGSDKATDMVINFGNAGTTKIQKFKEKKERVCRRTRRWGKRRRRCSDKITKIPYMEKVEKRVIIKKIEINGFDITSYLIYSSTSCDPSSGNVTKTENIDNGILVRGGEYRIPKSMLQQAIGKFVPKPIHDDLIAECKPKDKQILEQQSQINKIEDKYGVKSAEYDTLLAKFNKLTGFQDEKDKKISNASKKINIMNNEASDLEGQLKWAEDNINSLNQQNAMNYQKYNKSEGKYYQDVEKENYGLTKENTNRENANTTFKQKVFYKKETKKNIDIYNRFALYVYYFFVFAFLCISFYVDSKSGTLMENLYGKIFFIIIALIYPFVILTITKYVMNFFYYFYSILNGVTYEKIY